MNNLDSAIAYRRRGLSIIPIKPKDKKPYVTWEPYQNEPPSEAVIRHWFTSWPDANVAIVTGAVSDAIVIDLDSAEAKEKIKSLVPNYDLAAVPRVRTGRGGYHLFFKHPGCAVQTRAGVLPKTDVRADGGYVVTAPSVHENGKPYAWEVKISGDLPPLPPELHKLVTAHGSTSGNAYRERFDTAGALSGVPEGQRDETVFKLACKLRTAGVPREMAEALILEAAKNCDPSFPERVALEKVARSYSRYEPREHTAPRQAEIWPEFQSAEQILDEPDEPIIWRLRDCLPDEGSSVLVAPPKIGKTTFASNLALAIARGVPFLGRSTLQCPVAYAYLDGPPKEIKAEFKRLGLRRIDPVFIHGGAAPQDCVDWIMALVDQHSVRFVVIDTFQKFFKIQNINDYSEVVNKSSPMLDAAGAKHVHVLFLHHAGKGDRSDLDSGIGSTAIRGQVQSFLHLKLLPGSTRRIFRTDQRYGQGNFPEIAIGFDRQGWLEVKGSREDAEIQDAKPKLQELFNSEDSELTEKQIRTAIPVKAIIVSKALREMFKAGEVERSGEGKRGKPFRYQLASSLLSLNGHSEDSSPGGIIRGGAIVGHESKTHTQPMEKNKKDSSPNLSGPEWDLNGHESKTDTAGTRIRDWEDLP